MNPNDAALHRQRTVTMRLDPPKVQVPSLRKVRLFSNQILATRSRRNPAHFYTRPHLRTPGPRCGAGTSSPQRLSPYLNPNIHSGPLFCLARLSDHHAIHTPKNHSYTPFTPPSSPPLLNDYNTTSLHFPPLRHLHHNLRMLIRPVQFFAAAIASAYASPLLAKRLFPDPEPCTGNCSWVHDPNVYVEGGTYYRFSTSGNIAVATADDMSGPWVYRGALLERGTSIEIDGKQDIWVRFYVHISFLSPFMYSLECFQLGCLIDRFVESNTTTSVHLHAKPAAHFPFPTPPSH